MFESISSWENLYLAYRSARAGKRSRLATAEFEHHLEENLFALRDELRNQTYQPGAYHSFYIHEPKRRLISAAPYQPLQIYQRSAVQNTLNLVGICAVQGNYRCGRRR